MPRSRPNRRHNDETRKRCRSTSTCPFHVHGFAFLSEVSDMFAGFERAATIGRIFRTFGVANVFVEYPQK